MKKMIDELWDGEISPQDTLISDNQEYRELQHRQSKNKAELLEALSDEQKELLEKFCATEIEPNEFYRHLRSLGYYINRNHKYEHISVTPPGWNRTVRIDTLIPELDNKSLLNLFWENYEQYYEPIYVRFDFCPLKKYENSIWRYKNRRDNIQEFVDAIFGIIRIALGLDGCRNKEPRAVLLSPDFRKESAALKEHQNIIRFVSKHNIKTPQDIRDVAAECQVRMDDLKETRDILYNRIRRPKPTDTVEELKAARDSLTRDIAEVREQLKTANKLLDLLTRIEVYETEGKGKNRTQRIMIYYRFVGYIEISGGDRKRNHTAETRKGVAVQYLTA